MELELKAVFSKFRGNGGVVGNDDGDDEFALVADDHGIEDVGAGLQRVFDGLWGDEFSSGGFEKILFSIGDEEIVVFVEIADVAGLEPAVFGENFAGGFGGSEIALHDARALGADFAIFGDANLDIQDGAAGTPDAISGIVAGEDGRGFRQTIALVNANTNGPEKFGEILGEWGATGKNDAQFAAGAGANLGVDELIGDGPFGTDGETGGLIAATPRRGFARGLDGEIENLALGAGGFTSLLHQAGINFFEEARHGGEDGGLHFQQSLGDVFDDFDVGDRAAVEDIEVVEHAAIDMSERQERDGEVGSRIKDKLGARIGDVGAEIRVRKHYALGLTGGAGGVDERGKLAGENFGSAEAIGGDFGRAGGRDKSFVAEEIGGKRVTSAGDDDLLDFPELIANFEEFLKLSGAGDENDLSAAVIQDVGHAVRRFVEIDRDRDAARAANGEVSGVPFGAVGSEQTDAIAGFDAELH